MNLFRRMLRGNRPAHRARATAVVEFAVVLPLLLTILFGIIEYGYVFMVRQTLQHGAREGARLASLATSEAPFANVLARVDATMGSTNLAGYTATITTGVCNETVTISIPYNDVSLLSGYFGTHDYDLTGVCTMRKEGCTPGA